MTIIIMSKWDDKIYILKNYKMKNSKGFKTLLQVTDKYWYTLEYAFVCWGQTMAQVNTIRKTQPRIVLDYWEFKVLDESMVVDLNDAEQFLLDVRNAKNCVEELNEELENLCLSDFWNM